MSESTGRTAGSGWATRLPVVLVLVSLGLALLVPRIAQRRVARLRNDINLAAEPAHSRVSSIQLDLALESAARRGFLLTGDAQLAREIAASRARREAAGRQLTVLVHRLGAPVSSELAPLALRLGEVDAQLDSAVAIDRRDPMLPELVAEQQRHFDAALAATVRLDTAIARAADAARAQIAATEQSVALVTGVLLLLGLGAALLVARLGAGFRELAVERERLLENERSARGAAEQRGEQLERATASRTRLIRGFTHDVKNPLGAAAGFLALLEEGVDGTLQERQRDWVVKARRSIDHALELIGQLLDLARAEAGQLEIRRREVDVAAIASEVADAFRAQAAAKQLAISVDLPPGLPLLHTDPTRVRQVFGNLVSNAVKYTPSGGHVLVCASVRGDDGAPDRERLALEVTDDGPGIPEDRLPLLFVEFTRFDPGAAEGAGIGLAISQKIAIALGGDITVESRVGSGSTFTLNLPVDAQSDHTRDA